ncbi:hypothetical protein H2248_009278 [Termitomyces sp. 'cryptogamus']|nr:hypothetical protein H2248_009278 [Termitomyces sp. 'cryptogamus']
MQDLYAVAGKSRVLSSPCPPHPLSDFCLIPVGTAEPSVAEYIAQCQRILEQSGLTYRMQ